jgi:hypothetical protein
MEIRNQNAGIINNVEGTQNVHAPQVGVHGHLPPDVQRALRDLGPAVDGVSLPAHARARTQAQVRQVQAEMARPRPDRRRVAEHLTSLASVLASVGAVGTAVSGLLGPLGALAHWLGDAAPLALLRL